MSLLIAVFLGFILSLSALREIKRVDKFLERCPGLMSFIPIWSFFAPTPGMHDYHLMYRTIDDEGQIQDWKAAYTLGDKRRLCAFLWHPEKKFSKSLMDLVQDLSQSSILFKDKKQICLSIPYLHILNYISSLQHEKSEKTVQFMVLSNSRLHNYDVVFMSEPHPIMNG
jgi:hypothetical protein